MFGKHKHKTIRSFKGYNENLIGVKRIYMDFESLLEKVKNLTSPNIFIARMNRLKLQI